MTLGLIEPPISKMERILMHCNSKLEIIYEDDSLVVCHKLPGIPVQTVKAGKPDMVSLLRNYFAAKGEENTQVFVIHRLDQPVEGVIVFAREKEAAADLSRQSRERNMNKSYLALVEGVFDEPCGVLDDYLLHDKKANMSRVVSKGTHGSKHAVLRYEVEKVHKIQEEDNVSLQECHPENSVAGNDDVSLVRVQLETGRHHQIRVQMANAGHPLIGDKKYNPNCAAGYFPVGLCAVGIAFVHPVTGKPMEFTVEPSSQCLISLSLVS